MPNLLIAGIGFVGAELATRSAQLLGPNWRVWGLRRTPTPLPAHVTPIVADICDPELTLPADVRFDAVVMCVAAKESTPTAYMRVYVHGSANLRRALAASGSTPHAVFTSSTAVFPHNDGSWVDEDTPIRPEGFRGALLYQAEQGWWQSGWPATVVRFGGIYGPGRNRMIETVRQGNAAWGTVTHYTNRIHRDDCAGVLAHALTRPEPVRLWVGVDHDPADKHRVLKFLHDTLQAPGTVPDVPPPTPCTGKRCNSQRLRQSGYNFVFPTYREGYGAVLSG